MIYSRSMHLLSGKLSPLEFEGKIRWKRKKVKFDQWPKVFLDLVESYPLSAAKSLSCELILGTFLSNRKINHLLSISCFQVFILALVAFAHFCWNSFHCIDDSAITKHCKNCECCPLSLLIVKYYIDCHEFRFSIVRIVVSVSNVTNPQDCLKNCQNFKKSIISPNLLNNLNKK